MTNRWMMLTLVPALVLVMSATAFAQAQPSSTGAENAAEGSAAAQYQYEDAEECDESQYSDGSTNHEDSAAHSEEDTTGHEESGAHCGDEPTGHEGSAAHQGSGDEDEEDGSGEDQYEED